VDVAEDGQAGLERMLDAVNRQEPYQVVLVDWQMPGMDGWVVCERIREQFGESIPVLIMVTAHGREVLERRSQVATGMLDGYLIKPLTTSMLFDAIADAASVRRFARHAEFRPRSASKLQLCGLRLLLVEDNPTNQQVARELLTSEGATVEVADDGLAGVQAIANAVKPFDAVLMDVQMPVMDGFQATREIRERLQQTTLPVIAMTANAMPADRQACLQAGMSDFVGKPFDLDVLVRTILKRVDPQRLPSAPVHPTSATHEPLPQTETMPLLDMPGALARVNGKRVLLNETLRRWLPDLEALPQKWQIPGPISSEEMVRLLHTLKGNAGTLGAVALAAAASRAEQCWRAQPEAGAAALAELEVILKHSVSALTDHLANEAVAMNTA
jgi:CheY-like chemotaxis protein